MKYCIIFEILDAHDSGRKKMFGEHFVKLSFYLFLERTISRILFNFVFIPRKRPQHRKAWVTYRTSNYTVHLYNFLPPFFCYQKQIYLVKEPNLEFLRHESTVLAAYASRVPCVLCCTGLYYTVLYCTAFQYGP